VTQAFELADRFFGAIEAGDVKTVEAIYSPDVGIWHNNDGLTQTREQNLRVLTSMTQLLSGRKYTVRKRYLTDEGFAQEHTLTGTLPDGTPFKLDACIFIDIKDGHIVHLREYLDGASASGPFQRFAPARA
jgi:ketosteroid isomerase-like protein